MDRVLQSVNATINYKKCPTCKKVIDTHSFHKTCQPCRAKAQTKREKMRLKMKEMQSGYQEKTYITHRDGSQNVVAGVKRKAQKSLRELEGEELKMAMKMIKTGLKQVIRRHSKKPLLIPTVKSIPGVQEYQNASSLYDAIRSQARSNDGTHFLQFHGSHTIVAVSSISNAMRINLVATDLRKIARLSFDLGSATLSPGSFSYLCNCLGHTQAAASDVPEKSRKQSGSGSLVQWARANFTLSASQVASRICKGKVSVTVLDDNTHPLILGQQIIVYIDHPSA